ncbi:MAG: hypothetical protein DCF28_06065 [Alphaproteobacteria bacterium]|nr:MAG: hypothetical protein DCF28_06065 [Alphaproteobacteria bacterium]PZO37848.1 MAG: hypothetical protein DCE92_06970 [Alphaproteobacteria bacterium]
MSISIVGVVAALLLSQQVTVMENRSVSSPRTAARAADDSATRVCRTERVTGSNFSRRVCRTAATDVRERQESQDRLRRLQGSRLPDGS